MSRVPAWCLMALLVVVYLLTGDDSPKGTDE
jgi:hypothetical protein